MFFIDYLAFIIDLDRETIDQNQFGCLEIEFRRLVKVFGEGFAWFCCFIKW